MTTPFVQRCATRPTTAPPTFAFEAMKHDATTPDDSASRTMVHLVGSVTDEVFGFLGPATEALAVTGARQMVVMVDDFKQRHVLPRFHPLVELVLTPDARNPLRRWANWADAFRASVAQRPWTAVHLHGIVPFLIGTCLVRFAGIRARLFYSPHGSNSMRSMRAVASLLHWALGPLGRGVSRSAISNSGAEARTLSMMIPEAVNLVESPVSQVFFDTQPHEARRPLIVAAGRDNNPRSAELFAQMAVLLNGEALEFGFNWIGTADAESVVRLSAANVALLDLTADAERASRLAGGWVYLAPSGSRGFPLSLAEAMAIGVACIALDTPHHRDLIRHGETGYLCQTLHEFEAFMAMLIDDADLRQRIGRAGKAEAQKRFSARTFRESLRAAYGLVHV